MIRLPIPKPMQVALSMAELGRDAGEVPVGAVITRKQEIIAAAHNSPRELSDPTAHAEMMVIRVAASKLNRQRLDDCDLWVTLEPCPMCAGAISHARIGRLYYAAPDPKGGAVENGPRIFQQSQCHHRPDVYSGMGESESAELLRAFFAARRH
ncbi:MAG: nucleoside deaminase [Sphingomonadaceae bacterium]